MPSPSASRKRGRAKCPPGTTLRGSTFHANIVVNHVRHRDSLRTDSWEEADRAVKALRTRMRGAAQGTPGEESWKRAVVRWAAEVLPGSVKPSVAKRYLSSIRSFNDTFGDRMVASITKRDIAEWVSARIAMGKRPAGRKAGEAFEPGSLGPVSNASIRRDLTALSRLLAACEGWAWVDVNVAGHYDRGLVRENREATRPPSRAEIDHVIALLPAGMRPLVRLLDQTGMRTAEATNLERSEVDAERQRIILIRTKTRSPRVLPFVTPAGDATGPLAAGHSTGFLFGVDGSSPYANLSSNFSGFMRRLSESDTKVRRWHLHELRHAFAVRWLEAGRSIYKLSKHLGHKSLAVTEKSYLGWLTEVEAEAVRRATDEAGQYLP